jgi:hypothetical protein
VHPKAILQERSSRRRNSDGNGPRLRGATEMGAPRGQPPLPVQLPCLPRFRGSTGGGAGGLDFARTSDVAFGHCVFAAGDVESAFALLVSRVTGAAVALVP